MDLAIEVSAVTGSQAFIGIGELPIFSSRRLEATIRLRDGETNLMAGLLRDDERITTQGIPGLMDVPALGKLFSTELSQIDQTDVVMAITPHIVRIADIDDVDLEAVYVGTEANISGGAGAVGGVGPGRQPGVPRAVPAPGAVGGTAVLSLEPDEEYVTVGEEFAIDVMIDQATEIFSVGIALRFDPAVIQYVDAFEGDVLDMDGEDTTFQTAQSSPNEVVIGMARLGNVGGVTGSGSLATLIFEAVAPGVTSIEFSRAAIRTPDGRAVATQMLPASVEVEETQ